jgi:putative oxidoreductase
MNMEWAKKVTYFLLRVVTGLLFFQAGSPKFLGWFPEIMAQHGGKPPLMSQAGIGGMLEVIGGIMIMLGLCTRPVAFILSGEMAVAYWQFHAPNGTWPVQNGGAEAVLFCFIFLFMAAYGGGAGSIDAVIKKNKRRGP